MKLLCSYVIIERFNSVRQISGFVSGVNPAITSKIEALDASHAVQQFLKDLLSVEADSEGGKNDSYNAVIEEYANNPEIESWVQKSGV